MAGNGVAVIKVAKLAKVNTNLAPAIHREAYLVGFNFGERSKLAVRDPFRSKRSSNLKAIAFGEGALCFVVNAHTGKPRRVISEFAAIKKADSYFVRLVVSV